MELPVRTASFTGRLLEAQRRRQSRVCLGLDPDPERLPPGLTGAAEERVLHFARAVLEATAEHVCAVKFNFAFFEALGDDGVRLLRQTRALLPNGVLAIADAKRGDIGNSARFYASAVFDDLGFDAITVAPYMGRDAITPFLTRPGTAAFVLARTSNPGGDDFQTHGSPPLYERVVERVVRWAADTPGEAGFVVGATRPEMLGRIRELAPAAPFLVPGVGAQGGRPETVVEAGVGPRGAVLVSSSRAILYASDGPDFAEAAAREAAALRARLGAP